jgi:hypothetical protein
MRKGKAERCPFSVAAFKGDFALEVTFAEQLDAVCTYPPSRQVTLKKGASKS